MAAFKVLLALLATSVLLQAASAQKYSMKCTNYGGPFDGVAAGQGSFGLTVGGCGFGDINNANVYPFRRAVAFDPAGSIVKNLPSFGCGTCWKLTNTVNGKSVVATVTDICPGCGGKFGGANGDHADLHYDTWIQIAEPSQVSNGGGILDITAEPAPCVGAPTTITIMDYQGTWSWLRVRPSVPVTDVEISCDGVITTGGSADYDKADTTKDLQNTWGTVYEIKQIPLIKPGAACAINVKTVSGENLSTGPIVMDALKGFSVNKDLMMTAAANPAHVTSTGRKLLTQE